MPLLSRLAVQAARAYGILSSKSTNVSADYLVVAGGGGSAGYNGGGAGAGGLLTSTFTLSTLNTYSITVGAGGTAGNNAAGSRGTNGADSIISGTGITTVTSVGGGTSGSASVTLSVVNGSSGGSGGGAGGATATNATVASGTSGQGNAGGDNFNSGGYGSGGGGGASAVGGNGTTSASGNGGAGTASSISGSSVTYAGGGGGGSTADGATRGTGGAGGGGDGGASGNAGAAGTVNTGGGGGGGAHNQNGAAGGSGIVIISYTSATPKFVGGTITTSGGKQIHTFTSSGTLSPITPITANYLVVAGGGGGGFDQGGGGGAGGYQASSTTLYSGATYVVTVGGGGAGATTNQGTSGSNTSVSGTGLTTITSTGGGGGGGDTTRSGLNGGSGGGTCGAPASLTGGTGTAGQGNNGGTSSAIPSAGSGGGGAGAAGSANSGYFGGAGGIGSASSISGTSTYYAGGGGGGANGGGGSTGGAGGNGGGGAGASGSGATPGTSNTGGGGGGGYGLTTPNRNGAAGGSGIVIISYAGSQQFNGGLVTSSGGNTIHTFTSTGALTPLTNNLNNSLRFRSSASAYLSRTPTIAGSQTTWTFSVWTKLGALSAYKGLFERFVSATEFHTLAFTNTNVLRFYSYINPTDYGFDTTAVFRDPSAWYHVVAVFDTTNATAADRMRLYVNGNRITAFSVDYASPTQNYVGGWNAATLQSIGRYQDAAAFSDCYMAEINFIDGQALEPYYFGNNDANGVWKPIQYKGTYGTNGFYLKFSDIATTSGSNAGLGKDFSGNSNYWTTNNISVTSGTTYDAMKDVPTNTSATVANYPTINPLQVATNTTVSEANLKALSSTTSSNKTQFATMGISSGKVYWETTWIACGANDACFVGVESNPTGASLTSNVGTTATSYAYNNNQSAANGLKVNNGSGSSYGSTWTSGDIIGCALDLDNGKIWWSKNGTWQASGDPAAGTNAAYTGLSGTFLPAWTIYNTSDAYQVNFGQRPFSYTPPTGFVALNTYNLPTPTILQGNKYMDATLYTGTGTTNVAVNQGQFKPDFLWVKDRSRLANHILVDSVRGVNNLLRSESTAAEVAGSFISSLNSNGFTLSANTISDSYYTNVSGDTFVGWQWQAGQGTTSSNTSGSITSTVSVNTTAGFSIVTYTSQASGSATFGHGLGVAPSMIFLKGRNVVGGWYVYHSALGGTKYLALQSTGAATTAADGWNNTNPTSTLVTVGNGYAGSYNMIAYCWAEIAGFSKFGSYTGNGSTDGPFVYTGFRPKFIMFKRTDAVESWYIWDTSTTTYNAMTQYLVANSSAVEGTFTFGDYLSNGFKVRNTAGGLNASGGTFIFMAFAENPFKNANAR